MSYLISRQVAIDTAAECLKGVFFESRDIAEKMINELPSVQPDLSSYSEKLRREDGERDGMTHRFSIWYDAILPLLQKIVGKRYGCCGKLRNCTRCIRRNK